MCCLSAPTVSGLHTLTTLKNCSVNRRARLERLPVARTERGLSIGSFSVVEYWEAPIQEGLASEALGIGGRILEVGYGLGICARKIAASRPKRHVVVEAHPLIASWAERDLAATGSRVICALWEDLLPELDSADWDVIVFDAYPLDGPAFTGTSVEVVQMVTPALPDSARVLGTGGTLFFLDFTTQAKSSPQLREACEPLFRGGIRATAVALKIPEDCTYAFGGIGEIVSLHR